jgi:hypothetical protein
VTVFTESPHEFVSIELLVTVVVHSLEDVTETSNSMGTTSLEGVKNLGKDLVWGFTFDSESGVNVGVVSTSTDCEGSGEFFVVEATVSIFIKFGEDGSEFEVLEGASESLEGLSEFIGFNGTETVQIEVLEDFADSSSFVFSSVSLLSDLFEDAVDDLCETGGVDSSLIRVNSPDLEDHVNEVVFLLSGHNSVDFSIVFAPASLGELTTGNFRADTGNEIVENGFSLLLTRSNTGVSGGIVFCNNSLEVAFSSSTSEFGPSVLDHGESF